MSKPILKERYIGVKIIDAIEMSLVDAEAYLQRDLGVKEGTPSEGYLVEYDTGYESWSPKDVFERAYKGMGNETLALENEAFKLGMISTEVKR